LKTKYSTQAICLVATMAQLLVTSTPQIARAARPLAPAAQGATAIYLNVYRANASASTFTVASDPASATTLDLSFQSDSGGSAITGTRTLQGVVTFSLAEYVPVNFFGRMAVRANTAVTITRAAEPSVRLGNRIWLDANNNGVQDNDEAGMARIRVKLLVNSTGYQQLQQTSTDANGNYIFTTPPGRYIVFLDPTDTMSYSASSLYAPVDSAIDNDNNGRIGSVGGISSIRTEPVSVFPGSANIDGDNDPNSNLSVDFGLVPPANTLKLGHRVWLDVADDGALGFNDVGIANLRVKLLRNVNYYSQVAQTKTDASGYYTFTNLQPGGYIVAIAESDVPSLQAGRFSFPAEFDLKDDNNGGLGFVGGVAMIRTTPITLTIGGEPRDDGDGDPSTNLTIGIGLVTRTVAGVYEPNNTPCSAVPDQLGQTTASYPNDANDWYVFDLPTRSNLLLTATHASPQMQYLIYAAPTCADIVSNNQLLTFGGGQTNVTLSVVGASPQKYFVRIATNGYVGNQPYTFTLSSVTSLTVAGGQSISPQAQEPLPLNKLAEPETSPSSESQ